MKLVVTGGAGYIGSVVTSQLVEAGHEVTVVDDLSTGHEDAVPSGAQLVQARIHDIGDLLAGGGFDGVLHFGAGEAGRQCQDSVLVLDHPHQCGTGTAAGATGADGERTAARIFENSG